MSPHHRANGLHPDNCGCNQPPGRIRDPRQEHHCIAFEHKDRKRLYGIRDVPLHLIESINAKAVDLLVQALDSAGRVVAMDVSIGCFLNNWEMSRCIRGAYFKTAPFKYSLESMP